MSEEKENIRKFGISSEDIKNQNTSKLRTQMLEGIFALEAAMFSQAQEEFLRMPELQEMVSLLESQLLDEQILALMDPSDKITLYRELNKNMSNSMKFLQGLHKSITSAMESVDKIEELKKKKEAENSITTDDQREAEKVRKKIAELIYDEIKSRSDS